MGDDETKRQQYIRDYYQNEGIQLEYEKIEYNPGLRASAKMMLNSMWGKLGQRQSKTQVKEFDDPKKFHRFLDSNALDVRHFSVVNDNIVEVHHQLQEEDVPVSPNLNVFVACFTTCWARLRLYEALELLGQRVLYFDTDSVIYLEEPGQPNPPLGDYLGQFTSELKADDHITEFVSGGPKNYGYQTKNGKVECKVRGFRLNSEGKTQLNYDVMRQNVLEEIQQPQKQPRQTQVVKTHQIVRDAKTYQLFTFPDYKCYQLVYDKRVIDPDTFQTYPYGYHTPMPNQYLARLVRTPPDQLKQEESDLLHTWKKTIYDDVLHTVKNVPDWLVIDKKDLPKLLRALTRRDLPTLAQTIQTSSRFHTICENCGLFEVEPLLWDMVCRDIHETQAGRL